MSIEIDHVNKHFRDFVAVDNVSLTFRDGELNRPRFRRHLQALY
ncbi:hypothetical protein HACA111877_02575 [Halomonas casei]